MERKTLTVELDGRTLIFETGKIAKQANGSVMLHSGETTLLTTACATKTAGEEVDFLPLKVDYQEKFSSVGKTLGGFIKREGKQSTHEILVSRFIDRSLRPMFEEGYFNEIQVLSYVYSYDGINTPDVLAICGASAALVISDIPLSKPLGAVRVGLIDDSFVLNPNPEEQKRSLLDLVLAGTEDAILMIEGFCDFLTEEKILEAIDYGHSAIRKICQALKKWQTEVGKEKDRSSLHHLPSEVMEAVINISKAPIEKALKISNKKEREAFFDEIKKMVFETLVPPDEENPKFSEKDVSIAFKNYTSDLMRQMILDTSMRIDGRTLDQIRPIDIETGFLPRTHGNALFTRGETQSISVCTLGSEAMGQRYEDLHGEGLQRFYLQYFFPPFAVGEVGRSGPPSRREVGHGKLAERALERLLPKQDTFPYVLRLESNTTESNGSSSMAAVCGGCLALLDAGVPIKKPVAGIAMGLILEGERFKIISDIIGAEDALGDMDFKVAGDENGITAFQMDIKVEGITREIMKEALEQAKKGRSHILKIMLAACPSEKKSLSRYAPRIETIQINQSKIGTVIGPGGKQIRAIVEETKVEIDISDDGLITLSSATFEGIEKAKEIIQNLTGEAEIGKIYDGIITSIKPFGLFVKIYGSEGLCHISEVSHSRVNDLNDIFKEGDKLQVKVLDINDRGQIRLSHKVLLNK
jgi:polyribonucleotide nucleotidyltransferase